MTSERERELLGWLGIHFAEAKIAVSEADLSFAVIEKMREKGLEFSILTFPGAVRVSIDSQDGDCLIDVVEDKTIHAAIKQAAYNAMREERNGNKD